MTALMNSRPDPSEHLLKEIAGTNAAFIDKLYRNAPIPLSGDLMEVCRAFAGADEAQLAKLRALEEAFYREHFSLWNRLVAPGNEAPVDAAARDTRFAAPEWELPFFRYLRQAYELNSRYLRELGELAQLEPHAKRRLQYQLRHVTDALSPGNYAATNPEVIQLAAKTGGESLAHGMKLLAGDVARGRISMTDTTAFEVGRNLATTPGAVVLENEVMQLIQYGPATPQVHERPLLIVPPFINKFYILDLQQENSFARFCVAQGFTTFIVSWRNIPPELGALGWDDYIAKGVFAPIEAIKAIRSTDKVNALGFCVGGTLLSTALAVMGANNDASVASLTLLATLLDFTETGDISVYVDREFVERTEREFAQAGAMSGGKLASTFAMLRANDLIWHFVIDSYLKGRQPRAFDLLYWNDDGSNLPGRLYAWYLRNMYLENNLKVPGRLAACGVPLDLGDIKVPAFIVATQDDHIVPWRSAYATIGLLGGETEFVLGASGHIAGIVNPAAKNRRHFWVNSVGAADADAWFDGAAQQPGSWWKHWADWLARRSGPLVPAPSAPGDARHPVIEAAPGRYVKEKSA